MNNAETTFSLNGTDYKVIVYKGNVELYDLTVWASEGIERFVGYCQSADLDTSARNALALACLLANGYEVEFSCGGTTQVIDTAEGKCRFLVSDTAIIRNGESTYECSLNEILGMIYF